MSTNQGRWRFESDSNSAEGVFPTQTSPIDQMVYWSPYTLLGWFSVWIGPHCPRATTACPVSGLTFDLSYSPPALHSWQCAANPSPARYVVSRLRGRNDLSFHLNVGRNSTWQWGATLTSVHMEQHANTCAPRRFSNPVDPSQPIGRDIVNHLLARRR